jgi:hypothetical protein
LAGKAFNHVTLNNTRIFLFAIQGILIEHAGTIDRQNLVKIATSSRIGKINAHGDVFLDTKDMASI